MNKNLEKLHCAAVAENMQREICLFAYLRRTVYRFKGDDAVLRKSLSCFHRTDFVVKALKSPGLIQ